MRQLAVLPKKSFQASIICQVAALVINTSHSCLLSRERLCSTLDTGRTATCDVVDPFTEQLQKKTEDEIEQLVEQRDSSVKKHTQATKKSDKAVNKSQSEIGGPTGKLVLCFQIIFAAHVFNAMVTICRFRTNKIRGLGKSW